MRLIKIEAVNETIFLNINTIDMWSFKGTRLCVYKTDKTVLQLDVLNSEDIVHELSAFCTDTSDDSVKLSTLLDNEPEDDNEVTRSNN